MKLCKDCVHYYDRIEGGTVTNSTQFTDVCIRLTGEVDVVHGHPLRLYASCHEERRLFVDPKTDRTMCGPMARFWEKKEIKIGSETSN